MAGNIKDLNSSNFEDTVANEKLVLVDFWAPWCGPCKMIAPILDEVATELSGKAAIAKVNVDNEQALAGQFGVRAIPTMVLFKDGQEVDRIVGMTDKSALLSKLNAHI